MKLVKCEASKARRHSTEIKLESVDAIAYAIENKITYIT